MHSPVHSCFREARRRAPKVSQTILGATGRRPDHWQAVTEKHKSALLNTF
jgi:hypothetical protein